MPIMEEFNKSMEALDNTIADIDIDTPAPEAKTEPTAEPEVATPQEPTPEPVAEPITTEPKTEKEPEFFLGTYRTREDAQKGIQEKDDVINRLRASVIAQTGTDPLTGKPVQIASAQPEPPPIQKWAQSPDAYFQDYLKNPVGVQQQLFSEMISPVLPLFDYMSDLAFEVSANRFGSQKENEGFNEFMKTGELAKLLNSHPELAQRFQEAHAKFQFKRLPTLFDEAYKIHKGEKSGEKTKQVAEETRKAVVQQTQKNAKAFTETPQPGTGKASQGESLAEMEARLANVKF